jgi:uncharacterized protein (DUF58 family)
VWSGHALLTLAITLALLVSSSLLLWRWCCLAGVGYRRTLSASRASFGELVELTAELVNLKPLPLTWLRAEDIVPLPIGRRGTSSYAATPALGILVAMLPYQRIVRRMVVHCIRRGEHVFGPVMLRSGDYLGVLSSRQVRQETDRLIVYPKIFPVRVGRLPSNQVLGRDAARRKFLTDPIRTIGAREYVAGDPYRTIEWRASARARKLMVRVFEPSTTPILDIVLNFQPAALGWDRWQSDRLEFAISIAGSLARYGLEQRWEVGLRGNGLSKGSPIEVRPSAAPQQFRTILEALACAGTTPAGSLASMLAPVLASPEPRITMGATLLVITTTIDPLLADVLAELGRRGRPILVLHVGFSDEANQVRSFPIVRIGYDERWAEREVLVLGE